MVKLLFTSCFFLLFKFQATAVSIYGSGPIAEGKEFNITISEDYITRSERILYTGFLNDSGSFKAEFKIQQTEKIKIHSAGSVYILYVLPEGHYDIILEPADSTARVSAFSEKQARTIVKKESPVPLNRQIERVENMISSFYADNNIYFTKPQLLRKKYADFLTITIKPLQDSLTDSFVKEYLRMSLAPLENAVFQHQGSLYKKYFTQSAFRNPAWMTFFNSFFASWFKQLSAKKNGYLLAQAINELHSAELLLTSLQKLDTLLRNDTIREMLAVKGLGQYYYEKNANRHHIEMLLSYFKLKGIHAGTRTLAANTLAELRFLEAGSIPPDITFYADGKQQSIFDLQGSLVYIFFMAPWSESALAESEVIQKCATRYSGFIKFICISTDSLNIHRIKKVFKSPIISIIDPQMAIGEAYGVKAIPTGVLLDDKGLVFMAPAMLPHENLEGFLKNYVKTKK